MQPLAAAKPPKSSQGTPYMTLMMRPQTQNIEDIAQPKTVGKLFQVDDKSSEQISTDCYKMIALV